MIGKTPDEVRNHTDALIALLEGLGFIVNMEKSVLTPSQQIEFLGLLLNATSMCLTLPGHKIRRIRKEAALLLRQGNFSARKLAQFIGKLNAASHAGSLPSPTVLSPPSEGPKRSPSQGQSELRHISSLSCLGRRFNGGRST